MLPAITGFGPSARRNRHGDEAGGKSERHGRPQTDHIGNRAGRFGDDRPLGREAYRKRDGCDSCSRDRDGTNGDRRSRSNVRRRSPSAARSREA